MIKRAKIKEDRRHYKRTPSRVRFMRKVNKTKDCWLWTGALDKDGYGVFATELTNKAHRASYYMFNGPIPKNLCVCHKCDTPSCVNPKHLWLGTNRENSQDMLSKNRYKITNATLTENQVIAIRKEYRLNKTSTYKIARKYNVSQATIFRIISNKAWKNITLKEWNDI